MCNHVEVMINTTEDGGRVFFYSSGGFFGAASYSASADNQKNFKWFRSPAPFFFPDRPTQSHANGAVSCLSIDTSRHLPILTLSSNLHRGTIQDPPSPRK